jgi:ABC-type bacteriocin/lantibiotic exporters, contain an N-terminal double-glycine peptidase domain
MGNGSWKIRKDGIKQILAMHGRDVLMQKRVFALIIFCYFILTGSSFLRPLIIQKIIDHGLMEKKFYIISIFSVLLFLLALIEGGTDIVLAKYFVAMKNKLVLNFHTKVFERLIRTKLLFFSENNSAEIINKISTDINNVSVVVDSSMMNTLTYILRIISGAIGLFVVSWKLTFVVMAVIPIKFVIIKKISKKKEMTTEIWIKESANFSAWLGDMISGIQEIKLWGLYKSKISELRKRQKKVLEQERKSVILEVSNTSSDALLEWLIISILYGMGGYLVCKDSLSIGGLTAFISYSGYIIGPISCIFNIRFLFAKTKPSLQRLRTLLNVEKEQSLAAMNTIPTFQKEIIFEGVTFAYGRKVVLDRVNFSIRRGEKVAIIGDNGSGKSTLIKLILRFILPQKGCVLMDGINIEEFNLEQYRKNFGVVTQDIYLFNDTLKNNITLGKEIDEAVLERLCKRMELQSLLQKVDMTHNGNLEGNANNLSGGERQKIALVRAIIKDAPILILDEATANIDTKYSRFLHNVLMEDFSDKTILFVTHKKEHLRGVDRIFHI